jgi:hypothetical protein
MMDPFLSRFHRSFFCIIIPLLSCSFLGASGFVSTSTSTSTSTANHHHHQDQLNNNPPQRRLLTTATSSSSSSSSWRKNKSNNNGQRRVDHRPGRLWSYHSNQQEDYKSEWGVVHDESSTQDFPQTVEEVVDKAFDAIAGTLCHKQRLDPNVASNARSKSIFTHRPVRNQGDAGRLGVEIDGAELLFQGEHRSRRSSGDAIRGVALKLAAKLSSNQFWEAFEDEETIAEHTLASRPVTVCFNTIRQALVASQELRKLKQEEAEPRSRTQSTNQIMTSYDNVIIQCLADGIPVEMRMDRTQRRRYRGLADGHVNATRGIFIIVQPTDYNAEYPPPGPAVGAINNFQTIVAQASIEEIPMIALSPRFLSNDAPSGGGWDQSGYQKSSTYGGLEPPKGPTPWVMRDFTPPVYCWIGSAVSLASPSKRHEEYKQCYLSRVALTQSVMHEQHSWHMFAAKDCVQGHRKSPTSYVYLASTRSAAGRPTRALIGKILKDI